MKLLLVLLVAAYFVIVGLEPVSGWVWFGYWCVAFLIAWRLLYRACVWIAQRRERRG